MANSKYGHLVKKLKYQASTMGSANARQMTVMGGKELEGLNLNFIIGVYDTPGDWAPNRGAHAHPFDECLFFFGYDPDDISYLGSDMELAVGKEYEKHYFSTPMVVAAPAGSVHCPLVTLKVYKPFGHFHLALSPDYKAVHVKQEGTTNGKRYNSYFKPAEIKKGPGGADAQQIWWLEATDLYHIPVNVIMSIHNQTGQWNPGKGAQVHPYDECLVFFGHNTDDLSYLGAELTIEIGKEHEKHTFDTPTAIVIPKGTSHLPIVCNKVEKSYRVVQIGLAPQYLERWID